MIVCSCFHDDEDRVLAWRQHAVYSEALWILVLGCNRLASFARAVLNDTEHPDWGRVETFDHRVLQDAHDLLAAAWRFRNDSRQGRIPFPDAEHLVAADVRWLEWLRSEVASWTDEPILVRSVQLILANQNQPLGYASEARLCLEVMYRFGDVPWLESKRSLLEESVERAAQRLGKPVAAADTEE